MRPARSPRGRAGGTARIAAATPPPAAREKMRERERERETKYIYRETEREREKERERERERERDNKINKCNHSRARLSIISLYYSLVLPFSITF